MNNLSNVDETYKKYLLALADNMIRLWRSKIKGQGHSRPWRRHPRRRRSTSWRQQLYFRLMAVGKAASLSDNANAIGKLPMRFNSRTTLNSLGYICLLYTSPSPRDS